MEADCTRVSIDGLKPLVDFGPGETYQGFAGRLYPNQNEIPPPAHLGGGALRAGRVRDGSPIGVLALGYSLGQQAFQALAFLAAADPSVHPDLVFANGCQFGLDAEEMADSSNPAYAGYWNGRVADALTQNGLAASDVRVVWLHSSLIRPAFQPDPSFPAHALRLEGFLHRVVRDELMSRFPKVQMCLLDAPFYTGYAGNRVLEEPWTFESAFAIRWLVEAQIRGDTDLNYLERRGPVRAPWLGWAGYLWANGVLPWSRYSGFGPRWFCSDFAADGVHLSLAGQEKVGQLLLLWLQLDPVQRQWFLAEPLAAREAGLGA